MNIKIKGVQKMGTIQIKLDEKEFHLARKIIGQEISIQNGIKQMQNCNVNDMFLAFSDYIEELEYGEDEFDIDDDNTFNFLVCQGLIDPFGEKEFADKEKQLLKKIKRLLKGKKIQVIDIVLDSN